MSSRSVGLVLLPLIALVGAFWLLVLSPKREEASELDAEKSSLEAQVAEQEQLAAEAEAAREDFPRAYRRVVLLGKAAPDEDDTSSLLVQLNRISARAGVRFDTLTQEEGEGAAAPPPPAPQPQTPADTAETQEQPVAGADGGTPAPPATESQAALLPIGASIGEAGLPVMHYTLNFSGDFFALARFIEGLDRMVRTAKDGSVGVSGRLITIDGFDLAVEESDFTAQPTLLAEFTVTTYVTPPGEGATAGASPAGPAPPSTTQPTSTTPPASSVPSP